MKPRLPLLSAIALGAVTCALLTLMGGALLAVDAVFWRPLPGVSSRAPLVIASWNDAGSGTPTAVPLATLGSLPPPDEARPWCPMTTGSLTRVEVDGQQFLVPTAGWMPVCGAVFTGRPLLGRYWDEGPVGHRSVVVGERFWRERLGSRPDVLGLTLRMDDLPTTIIGVAPASFTGISAEIAPAVLAPLTLRSGQLVNNGRPVTFRYLVSAGPMQDTEARAAQMGTALRDELARDNQGLAPAQAAALTLASVRIDATGRGLSDLRTRHGNALGGLLLVVGLWGAMTIVVVGSLSVVLVRLRRTEFSVRRTLGAHTGAILRQLGREAAVPIGVGTIVAGPATISLAQFLVTTAWPSPTPHAIVPAFRLETAVALGAIALLLLFVAAISGALVVGRSPRVIPVPGRHTVDRPGPEVGLLHAAAGTVVIVATLAIGGGVWTLVRQDLGHRSSGLVVGRVVAVRPAPPADPHTHYDALLTAIQATGTVGPVALANTFPLRLKVPTRVAPSAAAIPYAHDTVSDNFFAVTGIPLLGGRTFAPTDRSGSPVAIVSEDFALRTFGRPDVIGRQIWIGEPATAHAIVGVSGATREANAPSTEPVVYTSRQQRPTPNPLLVAEFRGDVDAATRVIERTLQAQGRDYTAGFTEIEGERRRRLAPELTLQHLSFGALLMTGLLLAVASTAQLTLQAAAEWRHTVIRAALGESPEHRTRLVLLRAGTTAVAGVVASLPMLLGIRSALATLLPTLPPLSMWMVAVAGLAVIALTLLSATPAVLLAARTRAADVMRLT